MPRKKRSSPQGVEPGRDWLRPESGRTRPWAYEQLLFGSEGGPEEHRWLSSLAADLAVDLAELRRMQTELHEQVVKIAGLEGRIQALQQLLEGDRPAGADEPRTAPDVRSLPSAPVSAGPSLERSYSLARSEGFRVDSPSGFVGFVEGVRFVSRIDQPDLLEVRGGRFGRELMLIPIEAVDEISLADRRLVIRGTPRPPADHLHALVDRVRRMVGVQHPAL